MSSLATIRLKMTIKPRVLSALMEMAEASARISVADRLKVGCVITSATGEVISTGYNHMPDFMGQCCETPDGQSSKFVVHAEHDAIRKCADRNRLMGAIAIVTHQPCEMCAEKLASAGISQVIYKHSYRLPDGIEILIKGNVNVFQYVDGVCNKVVGIVDKQPVVEPVDSGEPKLYEPKPVKKWINVDRMDETTWCWFKSDDLTRHNLLVEVFYPEDCGNSYDVQVDNILAGMRLTGAFNI
ncbi:dCMP deaminase [Vibrio phage K369]